MIGLLFLLLLHYVCFYSCTQEPADVLKVKFMQVRKVCFCEKAVKPRASGPLSEFTTFLGNTWWLSYLLVRIQSGMWPFSHQRGWGMVAERLTLSILGVKCQSTKPPLSTTQSILTGSHVALDRDHSGSSSINILPHSSFSCQSYKWVALLMSGTWISCLTFQTPAAGREEGGFCPTPFYPVSVWMFNLRDVLPQRPDLRQLAWLSKKSREPKQSVSP